MYAPKNTNFAANPAISTPVTRSGDARCVRATTIQVATALASGPSIPHRAPD